jgi:hypothetical protein
MDLTTIILLAVLGVFLLLYVARRNGRLNQED